jgi:putative acetyltransferase
MVRIRRYRPEDAAELYALYRDTTHQVNGKDYTPEQCARWAPAEFDIGKWQDRLRARNPFVAVSGKEILGFGELENDGHIDFFYVHFQHQREGIGSVLHEAIEKEALRLHLPYLHAAVSVTAKSFFVRMGFAVVKEQNNVVCGAPAPNFLMRKELGENRT